MIDSQSRPAEKKNKKTFKFPLIIQINSLPLHSKFKKGKKFFTYVTENQNKTTVLRS